MPNAISYPTEPDTTIVVGDKVRSFDFEGNATCYMEGTVVEISKIMECDRYVIDCNRMVFNGRNEAVWAGRIYPPVNGTLHGFSGRLCCGVQKTIK